MAILHWKQVLLCGKKIYPFSMDDYCSDSDYVAKQLLAWEDY